MGGAATSWVSATEPEKWRMRAAGLRMTSATRAFCTEFVPASPQFPDARLLPFVLLRLQEVGA